MASTCSVESSVVAFPIGAVWEAVRTLKFEWCAALSGDGAEPSGECGLRLAGNREDLQGGAGLACLCSLPALATLPLSRCVWRCSGIAAQADRQGRSCTDSEGASPQQCRSQCLCGLPQTPLNRRALDTSCCLTDLARSGWALLGAGDLRAEAPHYV